MTERLLVCGLGSGMDRSLAELRSTRRELVVVTDTPTERAREAADVLLVCDPADGTAVLAELSAAGIDRLDGVFSLGADNPLGRQRGGAPVRLPRPALGDGARLHAQGPAAGDPAEGGPGPAPVRGRRERGGGTARGRRGGPARRDQTQ
ncbi:hypothetical protein R2F25_37370 [Streptomyces sp. UP1A-1]|nr:hypothetical protein [Streptomyces sp. UP1A-1]